MTIQEEIDGLLRLFPTDGELLVKGMEELQAYRLRCLTIAKSNLLAESKGEGINAEKHRLCGRLRTLLLTVLDPAATSPAEAEVLSLDRQPGTAQADDQQL